MLRQITCDILMVRPAHFGYNPDTALSNSFQTQDNSMSSAKISDLAKKEFDGLVEILRSQGVNVIVYNEPDDPELTDSIFPNNWFTTHENGQFITYPMLSPSRRLERRRDIIELIHSSYTIHKTINLEDYEKNNLYLEGTGSMILDRVHRLVYACKSDRTNETVLDQFSKLMNFEKVVFTAIDDDMPIYHTNVMMCIGESFVVICLDCLANQEQKDNVISKLEKCNKEIISINIKQLHSFAGNMLEVKNESDQSYLIMSSQAYNSLRYDQIEKMEKHSSILHFPIPTIENYGGGSVRCMMAEIFLTKKNI